MFYISCEYLSNVVDKYLYEYIILILWSCPCVVSRCLPWSITVYLVHSDPPIIEQYTFTCHLSEMRFVTLRTYSQKREQQLVWLQYWLAFDW